MTNNRLTLKWGTLQAWNVEGNDEAIKLLKRYGEIGSSFSAIAQDDTPEQKEIICKLIDLMPGEIYLSWDAKWECARCRGGFRSYQRANPNQGV